MKKRLTLAVLPLILYSCAHLSADKTVCPEYRDLKCATAPECSMDRERSCRVCECSPAMVGPDANTRPVR